MAVTTITDERRQKGDEKTEYRIYFVLAYPLFLVAAALARLMPGSARRNGRSVRNRSIFKEAADMLNGALPWVFSGR